MLPHNPTDGRISAAGRVDIIVTKFKLMIVIVVDTIRRKVMGYLLSFNANKLSNTDKKAKQQADTLTKTEEKVLRGK